jgi:mannose/fructose-specific phosphotransferase system component IIA
LEWKSVRSSDKSAKVHVLIVSHGGLALEVLASAQRVLGRDLEEFRALPLEWSDGIDEGRRKVSEALQQFGEGATVLILTDIFGGTPSNVANRFLVPGKVEVVSGVNLPMVVRLGCLGSRKLLVEQLAPWIREKGRSSICSSSELPRPAGIRANRGEKAQSDSPQLRLPNPMSCEDPDG